VYVTHYFHACCLGIRAVCTFFEGGGEAHKVNDLWAELKSYFAVAPCQATD